MSDRVGKLSDFDTQELVNELNKRNNTLNKKRKETVKLYGDNGIIYAPYSVYTDIYGRTLT